ncbi:MAG: carboxypeptidase-like regulatory domain-containing protein, partial [Hymenobacter sp.]
MPRPRARRWPSSCLAATALFCLKALLMRTLRFLFLVSCWLGALSTANAQGRITGVVQDSATHEPLAFASVFLANTTLGATTTEQGTFVFERVPKGTYDIVGSYVGYRLSKKNITVGTATQQVTLQLPSSGPQLGEVVVKADAHQEDNYRKFSGLFLGSTAFSKQCRITNPEEVDVVFNDTTKTLTATADNYVQVENKALGYRLKYFGMRFQYNTESEAVSYEGQAVGLPLAALGFVLGLQFLKYRLALVAHGLAFGVVLKA